MRKTTSNVACSKDLKANVDSRLSPSIPHAFWPRFLPRIAITIWLWWQLVALSRERNETGTRRRPRRSWWWDDIFTAIFKYVYKVSSFVLDEGVEGGKDGRIDGELAFFQCVSDLCEH